MFLSTSNKISKYAGTSNLQADLHGPLGAQSSHTAQISVKTISCRSTFCQTSQ